MPPSAGWAAVMHTTKLSESRELFIAGRSALVSIEIQVLQLVSLVLGFHGMHDPAPVHCRVEALITLHPKPQVVF